MTLALRLLRGYVGATLPQNLTGLYNGRNGSSIYAIGAITSSDGGLTWSKFASNPVISAGSGWESTFVVDPWIVWDGSQYVCYYAGWNGTNYRIGRATSPDGTTWTKYGSNPVLDLGTAGNWDDSGCNFPVVMYDTGAVHTWQMWYTGWHSGVTTVGYAYSSDGLSWTRVSQMLAAGSGGAFDDSGLATGPVLNVGGTYYVYYAGYDGAHYHTGYATATDPTNAATYTKHGVLSPFSGNIALTGVTAQSNQLRTMLRYGDTYRGTLTAFHPTVGTTERCATVLASDLTTFAAPTGPMLALGGAGAWDETSAENPSAIYLP